MSSLDIDDTPILPSQCISCEHLDFSSVPFVCKAFPRGIPVPILTGEVLHTKPYEGDNGVQYSPRVKSK